MPELAAPLLGATGGLPEPAPPVGLISDPVGNVATEQAGTAIFPSTAFQGADWFGLSRQVGRAAERGIADYGITDPESGAQLAPPEPTIAPDVANDTFGIPGHLKFDAPLPASVAKSMMDAKRDELARADAAARTPDGFWHSASRMGAGFVAGALDPLNIAAAFMPAVGEARMAGMLARAGLSGLGESTLAAIAEGGAAAIPSFGARLAVRGATGVTAGLAGQVPLVGLRYGLSKQEQADYTALDALADVAMGGILGGVLHSGLGVVRDVTLGRMDAATAAHADALTAVGMSRELAETEARRAAGAPDPLAEMMLRDLNADPDTLEAAGRTAVSQMAEDLPVEVRPVVQSPEEAAWYEAAATRALAGEPNIEAPEPAPGSSGEPAVAGQEGAGPRGRGVGPSGRGGAQGGETPTGGSPPRGGGGAATSPSDAFDRAAGYAHGRLTPEEAALARMADAATRKIKPDLPDGLPPELEDSIADTEAALDRANDAGLLTEADRAEVEASGGWLQQAADFGKGVYQAGVCLIGGGA